MKTLAFISAIFFVVQTKCDLFEAKSRNVENILSRRLPVARIVGGEEAAPHSLPYQVALVMYFDGTDTTVFCSGSLISRTAVLTAAHCLERAAVAEVILGAHRINENEKTQVRINSTRFTLHPQWNSDTITSDVALVHLPSEVELNDNIGLVKLPARSEASKTYDGEDSTISGWGWTTDNDENVSDVLREVQVEIMDNDFCNLYYYGTIEDIQICTSGEDGKSACKGDAGGPVVSGDVQVGIISFGVLSDCEIGWPSVHTRVTSFLDWIQQNSDVIIK